MTQQIRGLVLRTVDVGDYDCVLTLLTAQEGKISVFARGAKRPKSPFLAVSQLFCCADYTLYRTKSGYRLRDCTLVHSFFALRQDLQRLALATYLCEVALDVCLEDNDEHNMLQLTLNALWCLEQKTYPLEQIKGVFEFRCACIIGYAPRLDGCSTCKEPFGRDHMLLDLPGGTVLCDRCHDKLPLPQSPYEKQPGVLYRPISNSVVAALRYVATAPAAKQFSFQLQEQELSAFAQICEQYLLCHVEHDYHALTFYKRVSAVPQVADEALHEEEKS